MKFRLSTLLIVVTGLAILVAQHESAIRLTAVAIMEIALVFGWNARKGAAFPWGATLATAGGIDSIVAGIFFIVYNPAERLDARVAFTVLVAFGVAIGLFLLIGFFYVVYSLFQDPFRLNPGLPRRPPRNQSSN